MTTTATAVRERPILFSDEMVRAILEGRKTQTRRVVHPQPPCEEDGNPFAGSLFGPEWFEPAAEDRNGDLIPGDPVFGAYDEDGEWGALCRYGAPGDRLYVREAWAVVPSLPGSAPRGTAHGGDDHGAPRHIHAGDGSGITYRASWNGNPSGFRWRPSIHLPRWASRLTLEITDVRVERVQEISEEQVFAEGVQIPVSEDGRPLLRLAGGSGPAPAAYLTKGFTERDFVRAHFAALWDGINKKRGFGWDANPWVWAITFRRVED